MTAKSSLLQAHCEFSRKRTHRPLQQSEALPEAEQPEAEELPFDLLQQPSEREQGKARSLGQML